MAAFENSTSDFISGHKTWDWNKVTHPLLCGGLNACFKLLYLVMQEEKTKFEGNCIDICNETNYVYIQ